MSESNPSGASDVRGVVMRIAARVAKIEEQMGMAATEAFVEQVYRGLKSSLDAFSVEVLASRRERALQDESFNELKGRLDDQELRLTRLERERGVS